MVVSTTIGISRETVERLGHARDLLIVQQIEAGGDEAVILPTRDDVINVALNALDIMVKGNDSLLRQLPKDQSAELSKKIYEPLE